MRFNPLPFLSSLAVAACLLYGCKDAFPEAEPSSTPEKNFSLFYEDLRHSYPFFAFDHVNWDSLGRIYRPQVTSTTTTDALFDIMSQMLTPLMDGHASLTNQEGRLWTNAGNLPTRQNLSFSLGNILLRYNQDTTDYKNRNFFAFQPRPGILYIYLPSFLVEGISGQVADAISAAERTGNGLKGLILDVRNNGGGYLQEGENIAGLFASSAYDYAREEYKNGPDTGDFEPLTTLSIKPYRSLNFTKPSLLLTNRYSASTSERLRLALGERPNFKVIGDTTFGATSPIIERGLPNGFTYVIVGSVTYGLNNVLYERIGIPAQIRVVNTLTDLQQGKDHVLDRALAELP